jgi:hypothetical protein
MFGEMERFFTITHIGLLVVWSIRVANGQVIKTNVPSRSSYVTMCVAGEEDTKHIVSSPSRTSHSQSMCVCHTLSHRCVVSMMKETE